MKLRKLLVLLILFMLILNGCSKENDNPSKVTDPDIGSSHDSDESVSQASEEDLEQYDWIIKVVDTKTGTYKIPIGNKAIEFEMTLDLVAWKEGRAEIYGKYEGQANIIFDIDESKLSDQDIMIIGNAIFDRSCDKMEFEIVPYNPDEYIKHIGGIPGKVSIAPLGNFNAMTNFLSNWATVLYENTQATDNKTGQTLYNGKRRSDDGEKVPMGINMLIEGDNVTVVIPTYNSVWDMDFFRGKVASETIGYLDDNKLEELDKSKVDDGKEDDKEESMSDEDSSAHEENDIQQIMSPEGEGGYIMDQDGKSGFDTNGDGMIDIYIDEDGTVNIDVDGDGEIDQSFESEYGDGGGED